MKGFKYSIEEQKQFFKDNEDEVMKCEGIQALIVERLAAKLEGSKFVDAIGHDEIHPKLGRIETKYTNWIMTANGRSVNTLRITIQASKKDKFDNLRIIDNVNEKEFLIPHDDVYNKFNISPSGEFKWSSSYNKTDKARINNTKLLLNYERV